jgi:hypothetical protein
MLDLGVGHTQKAILDIHGKPKAFGLNNIVWKTTNSVRLPLHSALAKEDLVGHVSLTFKAQKNGENGATHLSPLTTNILTPSPLHYPAVYVFGWRGFYQASLHLPRPSWQTPLHYFKGYQLCFLPRCLRGLQIRPHF